MQIGFAKCRVFINALKVRPIPAMDQVEFSRPAIHVSSQPANGFFKITPVFGRGCGRIKRIQLLHRIVAPCHAIEQARRCARTNSRQQLRNPEPGNAIAQVLGPAQDGENVLDMRRLQELKPAELHEWNIAARIGRALRVTIVMYRSRKSVQRRAGFHEYDRAMPVPEIFQVRCLETGELFDVGACNRHTAEDRQSSERE